MELPTKRIPITNTNPKTIVLFGKEKSGKTTMIEGLEDALHIDFDGDNDHVSTMKIEINSITDLKELFKALSKAYKMNNNKPVYTYGILDTVTYMEELMLYIALDEYRKTPMGKKFGLSSKTKKLEFADVRTLPNGAGYLYTRNAFLKTVKAFRPFFKHVIFLGHTKDKNIDENGEVLEKARIDLSGKLGRLFAAKTQALGFVYRKDNKTIISFENGKDVTAEARQAHIRGKKITIVEKQKDGSFIWHWDKIFLKDNDKK